MLSLLFIIYLRLRKCLHEKYKWNKHVLNEYYKILHAAWGNDAVTPTEEIQSDQLDKFFRSITQSQHMVMSCLQDMVTHNMR